MLACRATRGRGARAARQADGYRASARSATVSAGLLRDRRRGHGRAAPRRAAREPAPRGRPRARLRGRPPGAVRVRRLLRVAGERSPTCRFCCSGRCPRCRSSWPGRSILSGLPNIRRGTWHRDSLRSGARRRVDPDGSDGGARSFLAPGPLDPGRLDVYAAGCGGAFRRRPDLDARSQRHARSACPSATVLSEYVGISSDRRDLHAARIRGRGRREERAALPARDPAARLALPALLARPRRALHEGAGAPARVPRHGDAALRRRRVRGQLHGAAIRARSSSS